MSAVGELGKTILDEAGGALARGLVEVLKAAVLSKDPQAVQRAALASAIKASAEAELQAQFATKRAIKKAVKKP